MGQYRRILNVALPIMISNAMLPLVGIIDTAVIGQIGAVAPLGAVAAGGNAMATVFWLFNFLAITTTAVVGRAIGAGDVAAMQAHLRRSLVFALVIGIALIALLPLWRVFVPWGFGVSDAVRPELNTYIAIRLLGAPATMLMHVVTGYLLAYERTRLILLIELLIQTVNITLDLLFVIGFDWGVAGVAVASVIAEITGIMVAFWLLRAPLMSALGSQATIMGQGVALFFKNNGYLFLRALGLNFTILYFLRFSAGLGDDVLAVNGILLIFISFTAQTTDGFAQAVEVFTAQSIGRRDLRALRQYALKAGSISLALTVMLCLVIAIFGPQLVALLTSNAELQAEAAIYLPWLYLAFLIGIVAWSFDGIFFGAALAREMMISTAITFALFILVTMPLAAYYGNHGIWFGFVLSYLSRAGVLAAFYPRVERLISAPTNPA